MNPHELHNEWVIKTISNPHTLLDELIASRQSFDTAFHWLTRVPESAIRLPHWDPDVAIEMWTSDDGTKRRLRWCAVPDEDVDIKGKELIRKEWEIWRLK